MAHLLLLRLIGGALVLLAVAPSWAGAREGDPPACVTGIQSSEGGERPSRAPVRLSPSEGEPGMMVSISAAGFAPGEPVTFVALYGEGDCSIVGLGDQFLGTARAGRTGSVETTIAWPATFDPVAGRSGFETRPLPAGRYYVVATPCARRADCNYREGTAAGPAFTLRAPESAAGPLAAAVAATLTLGGGVALLARRR